MIKYVIRIRNLKKSLNHGLVLKKSRKKLNSIKKLEYKTKKKKKNDSGKYFFMLINNAVFGKNVLQENIVILRLWQKQQEGNIWCQNQTIIQQTIQLIRGGVGGWGGGRGRRFCCRRQNEQICLPQNADFHKQCQRPWI